jgi:protein-arginine kinase activator protein McsA
LITLNFYCNRNVQKEDDRRFAECFQQDVKHMRECLSRSISPESDHTTARGMEHLMSSEAMRKHIKAKTAVIQSVLSEQENQRASRVQDPNTLAVISSALSLEARNAAIAQGNSGQEFVL